MGWAARRHGSDAHETGAGAEGKELFGARRVVNSCLKRHPPFPLKPGGILGMGGGALSFYPIVLLAFGTLESCPFIFLDLGALGPYPFIFLTCRTFGLHLFLFLVFSTLFKYLLLLPSEPMGETTPCPPHSLTVRGNTLTSPPFRNTCMCGANAHTSFPENGLGTFL